jgi:3-isopropylmalate/(R)-2-methylmalate dehydratase large subunit
MDSLGPDGGLDKVLEFTGPAIEEMSISSRMVLCNSVQYLSAQTAIINPDDRAVDYLKRRSEKDIEIINGDPDAGYCEELHYNLKDLQPLVVTPPDVYSVKRVTDIEGIDVHQAFVGTCISGNLEDLRLVAKILNGEKIHPRVRFAIIPGTQEVYLNAIKEGLLEIFINAGSIVSAPGCGPCFGGFGYLLPGENCICTGVLNTPGRMGSEEANIYLANPATVAASAVAGKITDPRNYLL